MSISSSGQGAGRRSTAVTAGSRGRAVGARPLEPGELTGDLSVAATLRAAALREAREGGETKKRLQERQVKAPAVTARLEDLRRNQRIMPAATLVVFVLDASDSMHTRERIGAAKGAILSILNTAYCRRDYVALVTFHGYAAELVLGPTGSVTLAYRKLRRVPVGGPTPFAHGLLRAVQLIGQERGRNRDLQPVMVVLSDGEANVPLQPGADCLQELRAICGRIRGYEIPTVCLDTAGSSIERPGPGGFSASLYRRGEMRSIAAWLGGRYRRLARVGAGEVVAAVRDTGVNL